MPRVGRVLDGASDGLRLERGEILAQPEVSPDLVLTQDLERLQPFAHYYCAQQESAAVNNTGFTFWVPRGVVVYDFRWRVQLGVAGTDRLRTAVAVDYSPIANALVPGPTTAIPLPQLVKTAEGQSRCEGFTFENTAATLTAIFASSLASGSMEWEHQTDQFIDGYFPVFGNGTGFLGYNTTATNSTRFKATWAERPLRSPDGS